MDMDSDRTHSSSFTHHQNHLSEEGNDRQARRGFWQRSPIRIFANFALWILETAAILALLTVFVLYALPYAQERSLRIKKPQASAIPVHDTTAADLEKAVASIENSIAKLQKQLDKFTPAAAYLTINTNENEFALYLKKKLVRQGLCSTGKYVMLEAGEKQKWIFKTPRGVRKVLNKQTAPVWTKPDWAYIEEGLPIPPVNHPSRYDAYALGEYKLDLGNGYMVHGTLYQRLLGKPVTHGCVRMGDEDLEEVYKTMSAGSKVYIY
ncbi:MAG: L,D-transpeptidase [Bacteroidales bacterium]|nr:L,D-transpeptidase [Lentimicrobiaceae bacterium]MDD5695564.1 L,D-transpeptidase [Bacteroidales bacterium]